jgi:hypothetical protein
LEKSFILGTCPGARRCERIVCTYSRTAQHTGRQGLRRNCYFRKSGKEQQDEGHSSPNGWRTRGPRISRCPRPCPASWRRARPGSHVRGELRGCLFSRGKYKAPLPFIPGGEGSGHVEALGEDVTDLSIGDAVAWLGSVGSYAERVVVPADRPVKVPATLELQKAAALMVQGVTAYYLSHLTFVLRPSHTALVHAAAGGVGGLLTQMAKRAGAVVMRLCQRRKKPGLPVRLAQTKSSFTPKAGLMKRF